MEGRIRIFTGIEVDILADGALDLSDEVLAQMDVVIGSVHSLFHQPKEEMTERVLRASRTRSCAFLVIRRGGSCCVANHSRSTLSECAGALPSLA